MVEGVIGCEVGVEKVVDEMARGVVGVVEVMIVGVEDRVVESEVGEVLVVIVVGRVVLKVDWVDDD